MLRECLHVALEVKSPRKLPGTRVAKLLGPIVKALTPGFRGPLQGQVAERYSIVFLPCGESNNLGEKGADSGVL